MSTIFRYLVRMGLPALVGALVWGITWPWRLSRRKRKGKVAGPYREGALLFLFMFLSGLLWLTLTPPDLEYFLQLKKEFADGLTQEQVRRYWGTGRNQSNSCVYGADQAKQTELTKE